MNISANTIESNITALSDSELESVNGGAWWAPLAAAVVVGVWKWSWNQGAKDARS